jgi:hypothetical protein
MQVALDEEDYLEFYQIVGKLLFIIQKFKKVESLLMAQQPEIGVVSEPRKRLMQSLETNRYWVAIRAFWAESF